MFKHVRWIINYDDDDDEHTFIFAALESFGFGPQFIQWLRTFPKNAESCVINNGHSTGYFSLKRGTRQGVPLSAYLFHPLRGDITSSNKRKS